MTGALALIIVLYLISLPLLSFFKGRHKRISLALLKRLFLYHYLFWLIYYIYAKANPSDSQQYYNVITTTPLAWWDFYFPGTPFIDFVAFPFVKYLGFSYEMMMALFAWMGYWGFVLFYIYFSENLFFKHKWLGFDLLTLLLFLPNMHFWTSSLGKGSIIFLGIGLAAYGLTRLDSRKIALIAGLLIVYHVRPHVFLFICLGIIFGIVAGNVKVPLYQKILVFAGGVLAVILLYNQILAFAKLDTDDVLESFQNFSSARSGELAKSGSGVNMDDYSLPVKLLTFWFRPLFFDAPGVLGLIVSAENLFYLLLAGKLLKKGFLRFLVNGSALIKASAVIFLGTSVALSFALSNLGIIAREKSMVMYFFFFIILAFMDRQKMEVYQRNMKIFLRKKRAVAGQMPQELPMQLDGNNSS